MANTTYSERLSDPRWQKRRLEIFQRDNWKCQGCNNCTTQLEVHHVDYYANKKPWEYPDDMLITVCHTCHVIELARFQHEKQLLRSFQVNGFLAYDMLALATMLHSHPKFKEQLLKTIRHFANS